MKSLALLRKERGFSRTRLAWELRTSEVQIWRWEKGLSLPNLPSALKLAKVLGISVQELYEILKNQKRGDHNEVNS